MRCLLWEYWRSFDFNAETRRRRKKISVTLCLCGYFYIINNELVHIANQSFGIEAHEANLLQLLSDAINHLILNDFNKLISILYRADISEKKLHAILSENKNENAGKLIALLYVERHLQKIKSRQENRRDENNIAEEDRW